MYSVKMGGVRGDVISLGFLQTRIMEMGESPDAQSDSNPSWVRGRQFTGRIVTVTNDKVFEEPIYNFTREFPFIWEEIKIPIAYDADRHRAEQILLECAAQVTESIEQIGAGVKETIEQKYFIDLSTLKPRVFYALTDNWVELNLRFLSKPHGARHLKDEISRLILDRFEQERIGIASGTYAVVAFPPLRIEGPVVERIARALEGQTSAERQTRRSA